MFTPDQLLLISAYPSCHESVLACITKLDKGKAIPLQAWTGPEGSRRMRLPDLKKLAHEGGKVVSPTH
jgi:hypothetical protein